MLHEKDIQRWVSSGYALEVFAIIKEDDKDDRLDSETLTDKIQEFAMQNLEERDGELNPQLTEEQLMSAIEAAGKATVSKTLEALTDKEMIQVSVRDDGEIVYGLTAKGQAFTDMLEDGYIKPEDFDNNFNEGKYD